MPSKILHSHYLTGAVGAATVVLGAITQESLATYLGLASILWAALLAGYDKYRAVRRSNEKLDLEARLSELKSERDALEAVLAGLRAEVRAVRKEGR